MKGLIFYRCTDCGNIVLIVEGSGVTPHCCGKPMIPLNVNTNDFSAEKHIPVVTVRGRETEIRVGSVEHPMTESHHLEWILLVTDRRMYTEFIDIGNEPIVRFITDSSETPTAAYTFCNLHGLWLKRLDEAEH